MTEQTPTPDFDSVVAVTSPVETDNTASVPIGSRLDDWWDRVRFRSLTPGGRISVDSLFRWGTPVVVTLIAAVLRLWNLGWPKTLVFDETYYVKDAWSLFNLGYEGRWAIDADKYFAAGDPSGFLPAPSYAVHPPLGKWIIGLGEAAFGGATNAFSWRISSAIVGILAVLLIFLIAKRLFGSTLLAGIAGFLFAIDGNAIVMSRLGLLDNFVMFFALLGFGAILLDRPWHERRLTARLAEIRDGGRTPDWGPVIWWRPWLITAGILFGLTAGVKWSGLYLLVAFGLYVVLVDAMLRRRLGLPFWFTGAALKQGPVSFLLLVPTAVVAYLATWTGWFLTQGGYDRHYADGPGAAWKGAFSWVPHVIQSLAHYHASAYGWHSTLDRPHSSMAPAWSWPLLLRPTPVYTFPANDVNCPSRDCVGTMIVLPNPIIWWAAVAACVYLVYRFARYRDWRHGLILMGIVALYLPWLMWPNRTMFFFYTIAFEPYLILGLVAVIGIILGTRRDPRPLRTSGLLVVGIFLGFSFLISLFWYPLWTGTPVSNFYWQLHQWLPGWWSPIFDPPTTPPSIK